MASRKLTALPTATEVTTSDKIYIVDVSDTTESPQGTSKQATLDKIIQDGEWTPTITNQLGSATITLRKFHYQKVGNTVSIFGNFVVLLEPSQSFESFNIDLPIEPSSNFADDQEISGVAKILADYNVSGSITVNSVVSAKTLLIETGAANGETLPCYFSLAYTV